MKKIALVLFSLVAVGGLFAQAVPQPAFRLLDGYLEKRTLDAEYGAKIGPWVMMGTGVALAAASATVWYAGDDLARAFHTTPNADDQFKTTLGLGIGAVVATGIGLALQWFPPAVDERARYSAIYAETDPVLQEKMAAARIEGLAEKGKTARLVSGWVNLGIVGASYGFRAVTNQENGRPWSDGLFNEWGWELGTLVGSAGSLLVPSSEEFLYQEYLRIISRSAKG